LRAAIGKSADDSETEAALQKFLNKVIMHNAGFEGRLAHILFEQQLDAAFAAKPGGISLSMIHPTPLWVLTIAASVLWLCGTDVDIRYLHQLFCDTKTGITAEVQAGNMAVHELALQPDLAVHCLCFKSNSILRRSLGCLTLPQTHSLATSKRSKTKDPKVTGKTAKRCNLRDRSKLQT
jgi:hypothetical protein